MDLLAPEWDMNIMLGTDWARTLYARPRLLFAEGTKTEKRSKIIFGQRGDLHSFLVVSTHTKLCRLCQWNLGSFPANTVVNNIGCVNVVKNEGGSK
jgi:hypothetical protein